MERNKEKKLILIILTAACILILAALFRFNQSIIIKNYNSLKTFIENSGMLGAGVFVLITVIKTIFPVFPTEPFELLSGAVYGAVFGGLLCHLGILIGALAVYCLGKGVSSLLLNKVDSSNLYQKVLRIKESDKFDKICFLLFLLPGTPKEVLMIILCAIGVDFKKYLFYVTVLRIPSVFSSTITGAMADEGRFIFAVAIYAATFLLSLAGYYYHKKVTK